MYVFNWIYLIYVATLSTNIVTVTLDLNLYSKYSVNPLVLNRADQSGPSYITNLKVDVITVFICTNSLAEATVQQ